MSFCSPGDVELFSALAPAVVARTRALRRRRAQELVRQTLAQHRRHLRRARPGCSRQELRKLLDLLAIGPLRYVLTGVGDWNEASTDKLQAFLARWRGSRFATLNAGGNVLVRLVAAQLLRAARRAGRRSATPGRSNTCSTPSTPEGAAMAFPDIYTEGIASGWKVIDASTLAAAADAGGRRRHHRQRRRRRRGGRDPEPGRAQGAAARRRAR